MAKDWSMPSSFFLGQCFAMACPQFVGPYATLHMDGAASPEFAAYAGSVCCTTCLPYLYNTCCASDLSGGVQGLDIFSMGGNNPIVKALSSLLVQSAVSSAIAGIGCLTHCILDARTRSRLRAKYGIDGSFLKDLCCVCMCVPCTRIQMLFQVPGPSEVFSNAMSGTKAPAQQEAKRD